MLQLELTKHVHRPYHPFTGTGPYPTVLYDDVMQDDKGLLQWLDKIVSPAPAPQSATRSLSLDSISTGSVSS